MGKEIMTQLIYISRYGKVTGKFGCESHLHRDIISARLKWPIGKVYSSKPVKVLDIMSPYFTAWMNRKRFRPMNVETQYDLKNDSVVDRNRVSKHLIKIASRYYSTTPKSRLCESGI